MNKGACLAGVDEGSGALLDGRSEEILGCLNIRINKVLLGMCGHVGLLLNSQSYR